MALIFPHVEEHDGTYYIAGQRVRLASIIYVWLQGRTPEAIAQDFPVLTLAEVYAAITCYLDQRAQFDEHFRRLNKEENANEHDALIDQGFRDRVKEHSTTHADLYEDSAILFS